MRKFLPATADFDRLPILAQDETLSGVDPYRAPQVPPREPGPWRDPARAFARLVAVALPVAVGWVVTADLRRAGCGSVSYLHLLWGVRGFALACTIGVSALLLSGARFSSRT